MAMTGNARAQAIYNTLNLAGLDVTEKQQVLSGLQSLYGADTTYIQGNAVVSVNTTSTIPASSIATAGSPSAQTGPPAPVPVSGSGTGTVA